MNVEILSVTAESFPTEIEYDDLLELRHRMGGRGLDGTIDCLGIVISCFRRAGLGLPDPVTLGRGADVLHSLFEEVSSPDAVLDVAELTRGSGHVWVLIRPGVFLSAKLFGGVYTQPAKTIAAISGVKFWRIRDEYLP